MSCQTQLLSASEAALGEDFLSALSTDLDNWALFLDIDGTLLDLAATPDAVIVPPSLPTNLDALSRKLGGALALVTGRALDYVDQLFSLSHFPVAGLHGAERRDPDGFVHKAAATAEFERLKADLVAGTANWAGVLIEDKGAAVAAHYRLAPARKLEVELLMERALIRAGPNWTIQHGKMEIRPARADKGRAVAAFLAQRAFAGRRALAIGDDVTDEAMFRTANRLGGYSIRIGSHLPASEALGSIRSANTLRDIIAELAS
ncbi:trehalose-phosphatase [Sinorhizobium sp. CCBAU 05631]|uniref:trehalose-phosphatase n=1 Tax=Sinorhizobium sp. CCBAU 05631 TaxID=794846 RepID=UPI0004AF031B|nr:trehalose-phosphatase [Sinorhizobium sp. CCBAU 05631]ASY59387.1 Trehalose-6-phosphate phosphatase [Sinorhizobium sp. CCBAU 05631]